MPQRRHRQDLPFLAVWIGQRHAHTTAWQSRIDSSLAHYEEPRRVFHNIDHVNALLAAMRRFAGTPSKPKTNFSLQTLAAIELAIIYHDAIYIVGDNKRKPGQNEKDSAK